MKSIMLVLSFVFLFANFSIAQDRKPTRDDFVSDASMIVGTYSPDNDDHSPAGQAAAANKFLDSLDDDLKQKAKHDLDSQERREWTNLPARPNAGGVRMGDLNDDQIKRVLDLMACLFSQQGYDKMCHIMLADDQLLRNGQPRSGFGTEDFSIVIFAQPDPEKAWAFQIDGHHVGVNVSINGAESTISPSFIGTQPEAFTIAGKKFEPFSGETNDAYQLVSSLNDEQLRAAVLQPKRGRILTGPGNDGQVPNAKGVAVATFDDSQKKQLLKLIANWVNDMPEESAKKRMEQIEAEIDEIKFAWNGKQEPGSDISYTIQGPSLIIEYACQDLGGNPLAHLHSVYRDPTNEYGKQLNQ